MTYYEGYLARAGDRRFNWRTSKDPLAAVKLVVPLVHGLNGLVSLARAISDGQIEGRQIDWGAWIAPVTLDELPAQLALLGWPMVPSVDGLDPGLRYFVVGVET